MKSFTFAALVAAAAAQQSGWAQCGGIGFSGSSACAGQYYCSTQNPYYAQCVPGTATAKPTSSAAPTTLRTTTTSAGSPPASPTTTKSTPTSIAASPPPPSSGTGKVKYAGVNIAGFDFGCNSAGQCTPGGWFDIVRDTNGVQQLQHLASIGLNAFRLPIGWQYIVNNVLGGPINATSDYYTLVQTCLDAGAKMCIIDIHNYARWNGAIIGQGGPTNAQYANLWSQIATKYASESRIAFDVMNEPHDIPSIPTWAASVQAAVTAIRQAGATSQIILLPGDNWTSAGTFVSGGSADALNAVTNPDGSKTNLIMNVHKYLDSDNSGTTTECVTNNIDGAFAPLATWLRANKRQAMLTETGGGNVASCETYMCQELAYLNQNSDVYLGWTGWAAGGFYPGSYALDEVPTQSGGVWTDTPLVKQCIAGEFLN